MPTTGAPLGSSPFGPAIPTTATEPATDTEMSRYIDPNNGTYSIDSTTGVYRTMPSVRQRVMIALITELGSSSTLRDLGTRRIRKIGPSFVSEQQAEVRRALRQLTDVEKVIRIDRIDVKRTGQSRGETTVVFTDIESGQTGEVVV